MKSFKQIKHWLNEPVLTITKEDVTKVKNWLNEPVMTVDLTKVGRAVANHFMPGVLDDKPVRVRPIVLPPDTQLVPPVRQKVILPEIVVMAKEDIQDTKPVKQGIMPYVPQIDRQFNPPSVIPKVTPVTPKVRPKRNIVEVIRNEYALFEIEPSKLTSNLNVRWFLSDLSRLVTPFLDRITIDGDKIMYRFPDSIWWEVHITQNSVKFYLAVPDEEYVKESIIRQAKKNWKQINVRPVAEHLPRVSPENCSISSMTLEHNCILPLALTTHNYSPIDTIIGTKNYLGKDDECILQIGLTPMGEDWTALAKLTMDEIKSTDKIPKKKYKDLTPKDLAISVANGVGLVSEELMNMLGDFLIPGWEDSRGFKDSIQGNNGENDPRAIKTKAKSEGFKTSIRMIAVSKEERVRKSAIRALSSTFDPLSENNTLIEVPTIEKHIPKMIEKVKYREHTSNRCVDVLTSVELCKIINLPDSKAQTEYQSDLNTVQHRGEVEIPKIIFEKDSKAIPFMRYQDTDGTYKNIYFQGKNMNFLCMSRVVMGEPGSGKSSWAVRFSLDAFYQGYGSVVIDPADGKMIERILSMIAPDQLHRVKIIDFTNDDFPIGLGWNEAFRMMNQDMIEDLLVEECLYYLEMIAGTPFNMRSKQWVENAVKAVYTTPDATLLDVENMLCNDEFRNLVIPTIKDPQLKADWEMYSNRFSKKQRDEIYDEAFRRLAPLMRKKGLKKFVLQSPKKGNDGKYEVDFRTWMDEGYLVLIKANETLGETIQTALVSFVLSKFNLAIISREDIINEDDRKPCFLILDEPDHYIKGSERWRNMLTRYRKYHCGVTLMFHGWQQLIETDKNLCKIIRKSGPHYIIFQTDEDNLLELQSVIEPEFKIKNIAKGMPKQHAIVRLKMYNEKGEAIPAFMAKALEWAENEYKVYDNVHWKEVCAKQLGRYKDDVLQEIFERSQGRSYDPAVEAQGKEEELVENMEKVKKALSPEQEYKREVSNRRIQYEVNNYIEEQLEKGEEPDEEIIKHMDELLEEDGLLEEG